MRAPVRWSTRDHRRASCGGAAAAHRAAASDGRFRPCRSGGRTRCAGRDRVRPRPRLVHGSPDCVLGRPGARVRRGLPAGRHVDAAGHRGRHASVACGAASAGRSRCADGRGVLGGFEWDGVAMAPVFEESVGPPQAVHVPSKDAWAGARLRLVHVSSRPRRLRGRASGTPSGTGGGGEAPGGCRHARSGEGGVGGRSCRRARGGGARVPAQQRCAGRAQAARLKAAAARFNLRWNHVPSRCPERHGNEEVSDCTAGRVRRIMRPS